MTARVIGSDGAFDVALLKLDTSPSAAIKAVPLNDDGDLNVGDIVRACGYPNGWNNVYSVGAPVRSRAERTSEARFMALGTDQSRDVLCGMSGGPVLDADGAAVGILVHFPEKLNGVIHAARLADVWQVLTAWREEQPDWESAGQLSRNLRAKLLDWDRLALVGPFRNRSSTDLSTVFVQQRFGRPTTAGSKRAALRSRPPDAVPAKAGGLELLLTQLRTDERDVVLRGDAGTGKSVLLRRLAAVLASEWLAHAQRQVLPILVQASEFVHQTVDAVLGNQPGLRARTGRPHPILLVDGLDEIVDVTERRLVVERIRQRIAEVRNLAAPPVRFVLASRPLAVLDEIPAADAVQYVVQPWSSAQIRAFAKRWFVQALDAERFLRALETARLSDLAAVPALATVAAVVFEHDGSRDIRSDGGRR